MSLMIWSGLCCKKWQRVRTRPRMKYAAGQGDLLLCRQVKYMVSVQWDPERFRQGKMAVKPAEFVNEVNR